VATSGARAQAGAEEQRVRAALTRAAASNHLRSVFDRYAIGLVVDAGAHHGQFARLVRGIGYQGPIVSYEPVASACEELAHASAEDPAWTIHRLALGTADGRQAINVSRSTDFSSFRRLNAYAESAFPNARKASEEIVEMRRLDGLLDHHAPDAGGAPIFLKIDTQGSDLDVLEGAAGVLDRVAAIQTEVPLRPLYEGVAGLPEVLATLRARAFALSGVFPVSADDDLRLIEVDCVAVRT
jgi:FkbM family methyltransferase